MQKYVNDANKSCTMYCNIDEECMKDFVDFFVCSFVFLFILCFHLLLIHSSSSVSVFFSLGIFALLSHQSGSGMGLEFVYKKNVRDISSGCKPSNSDNG